MGNFHPETGVKPKKTENSMQTANTDTEVFLKTVFSQLRQILLQKNCITPVPSIDTWQSTPLIQIFQLLPTFFLRTSSFRSSRNIVL